ncbi:hypothetical protein CTAYLR_001180 [Chrysophaeum taylorii]|uniref:AAA+ ATPase domain-containing protein n=1 Tax=Chrysophaeum taylorii TaxID=2483200 RepID=A0AAD7UP22_9STRA|nr:hypothetical protein CTAYLR_001180 [Chrysophaeum taylorii]
MSGWLGLFGPAKRAPGEALLKSAKEAEPGSYSGSGFDPTGLERAAKAAREIDVSEHASLAFDVIQQQEVTKQLEHASRSAAYEMQARQYELGRLAEEATEARKTLEAQTEHANRQAKYQDDLERHRYASQIQAQREVREAELRRLEESAKRQEELRRKTIVYEAELREKTELARAKAEADAKARTDRENHDLSLELMREEMREKRETLLASMRLGFSMAGGAARDFLNNPSQMMSAVGVCSAIALGIFGARSAAGVAARYVEARLGKPSLVRETSRATPFARKDAPASALEGVVLAPSLERRLEGIAVATKNTKANRAPFRHLLLHGPPGTGKTLFAKKLALSSGLDYAILTGGDVAPLGRDAVTEIHKLFDWARTSHRGLLLFIDEADAFLRRRTTEAMSEDLRNAFNAFLYRTGDVSTDYMLVYASNAPEQFDWAINDRIDEIIEFHLPTSDERDRMLRLYLDAYFGDPKSGATVKLDSIGEDQLKAAVEATEGFSGREIAKLVIAWQSAAHRTEGALFTPDTMRQVLTAHVAQRQQKSRWISDKQSAPL